MSYLIIVLLLAVGMAAVLYLALRSVDTGRRAMVAELSADGQGEFSQILYLQDSCLVFDGKASEIRMVQRLREGFHQWVMPYSRLLYAALLHNGRVVAAHCHADRSLAAYVDKVLIGSDDISCCYQIAGHSGVRLVGGMQGQTGICIFIPDFEQARSWHARFGVLIRQNSDKLARLRQSKESPEPEVVHAPEPVVVVEAPADVSNEADNAEPSVSRVTDNAAAYLRDQLGQLLDEWLEDQTFVIVAEKKLRDRLELEMSIASFHKLMNELRRSRAFEKYALSFTRKTESWRLSRRRK